MNTQLLTSKLEKFGILILTFFFSVMAFAQDATKTPDLDVDVTTTKTTRQTHQQPTTPPKTKTPACRHHSKVL